IAKRVAIAIPLFALSYCLTTIDFDILWRYFSFPNQGTAALALWIGTMYLLVKKKNYFIPFIPAFFITDMLITYILFERNLGFGLSYGASHIGGIVATVLIAVLFFWKARLNQKENLQVDLDVRESVNDVA